MRSNGHTKQRAAGRADANSEPLHELLLSVLEIACDVVMRTLMLAKIELRDQLRADVARAAGAALGAFLGLVAFVFASTGIVVLAAPLLPPLWARLLVSAGAFFFAANVMVGWCVWRLRVKLQRAEAWGTTQLQQLRDAWVGLDGARSGRGSNSDGVGGNRVQQSN